LESNSHVPQAGQILKVPNGPIQCTPVREAGERYDTFRTPIALDRLIAGTVCATTVAILRGQLGAFAGD
jgi:hypothetical protein